MKTVLLVDDEYALVEALTGVLEDEGYRVIAAANGAEGLRQLEEILPDVAIVDVMMPRVNGPEMLRAMRADPRFSQVPVILVSAAQRYARLSDGAGASAFLHKPFTVHKLLETIRRITEP